MTAPRFILQANGSFNFGAFELNGHNGGFSRGDFLFGRNFGARNGFSGNLTGKYALSKTGNFYVTANAGYSHFQSSLFAKNEEEGNVSYNVICGGLGMDYYLNSYHKVKYFIGGNILASAISGKALLISYDNADSVKSETQVTIKSSLRVGYSVFAGIDYALTKQVGINVGFKWTHINLLMKKSQEESDQTNININDNSINPPTLYGGWKQFAYASAFAGVSFYFGVKQRRYKILQ